jgi:hypothetical protein
MTKTECLLRGTNQILSLVFKGYKALRHEYIDEMNRQFLGKKLAEISALRT